MYLTVPFVLSWSLLDALACGATILASDTEPVREMIAHGENGLLVDFFDDDAWVKAANRVLDRPGEFEPLGMAGARMIRDRYSLEACLPQMLALYERATTASRLAS
jgi:glycosyltransferase involved in cell wall biosynthesis